MQLLRILVNDVVVTAERQRQGLGDDEKKARVAFDDLKRSMTERGGLINPIRIDGTNNNLLAGYRRLMAARELEWEYIDATTANDADLDPLEHELIELDENLQRLDLSWQERTNAISRVNEIRTKQDSSWTQQRTGDELGIAQSKVSEAVMLNHMMTVFPDLKQAKTKKQAISMAKQKSKTVLRKVEQKANPEVYKHVTEKVVCALAEDYIASMPDGSAGRLILTDGPFGIDYDKKPAGEGVHEAYEDSPESYILRTERMASHLFRVLPQDGFMVWFLAHDHYETTRDLFRSVGFLVDPVPIMWNRSEGRTYSARPDRWFGKGYDIALHCIKGNPELIQRSRQGGNVFTFKPVAVNDKEHIVERPIELYAEIIKCMTLVGEKVTDFFGGSGKVAAAAASLRRDHFTVEANPNHLPTIINNIFNNTPQEKISLEELIGAAQ